jgi:hypothetical protein
MYRNIATLVDTSHYPPEIRNIDRSATNKHVHQVSTQLTGQAQPVTSRVSLSPLIVRVACKATTCVCLTNAVPRIVAFCSIILHFEVRSRKDPRVRLGERNLV